MSSGHKTTWAIFDILNDSDVSRASRICIGCNSYFNQVHIANIIKMSYGHLVWITGIVRGRSVSSTDVNGIDCLDVLKHPRPMSMGHHTCIPKGIVDRCHRISLSNVLWIFYLHAPKHLGYHIHMSKTIIFWCPMDNNVSSRIPILICSI